MIQTRSMTSFLNMKYVAADCEPVLQREKYHEKAEEYYNREMRAYSEREAHYCGIIARDDSVDQATWERIAARWTACAAYFNGLVMSTNM